MGINISAVKVLLEENIRRPFSGNVLTLGRQDVFLTSKDLEKTFAQYNKKVNKEKVNVAEKEEMKKSNFISDDTLFLNLDFADLKSLDASPYEGADYIHDMNISPIPEELNEKFDCIFDGGTLEHIFHAPNALKNIFDMLRVGGRIIHIVPSSNHIDHGFYMFSPTLFWDYYRANKFEINTCDVFKYTTNIYDGLWEMSTYVPGVLHKASMGGLDDGLYGILMVATKTADSLSGNIPQQGMYADYLWDGGTSMEIKKKFEDVVDLNFKGKGLGLKIKSKL